jgi:hypothetical protein
MIPPIYNRSYSISADLDNRGRYGVAGLRPGVAGVIVAESSFLGGFSLYVENGHLKHTYSLLGLKLNTIGSRDALPTGKVNVRYEFNADKPGEFGTGGTARLFKRSSVTKPVLSRRPSATKLFTAACPILLWSQTRRSVIKALYSNTTGNEDTANGYQALYSNITGVDNTATGSQALYSNTGNYNTATGSEALYYNTIGEDNVATGDQALFFNTTGHDNTATGDEAMAFNTTGIYNTANGEAALFNNTTGNSNTAYGIFALGNVTTGISNIAIGADGGCKLTTGNANIAIGNPGVAGESHTIRIGDVGTETNCSGFTLAAHTATYIAGIANAMVSGSPVYIDTTTSQLGLQSSSERFKDAIAPMANASEPLFSLRPVTFVYKKNIDQKGIQQFGLVAEDVEKVDRDLVVRDAEGKVLTVRYDAVNAMLLNEFLKEHQKVEQLTKDFELKLAEQQRQIQQLTAGLEQVSAQLQLRKPEPRTVLSDQ